MRQTLILVNRQDKFLGKYAKRTDCHKLPGLHHRAFVCLLFNSKRQILLQKRRHLLWDNLWDVTAVSHPLHLADYDESYQEAGIRALKKEMGISKNLKLVNVGGFNYFARYKNGLCENEYCAILAGFYNGKVKENPASVYQYRWILLDKFLKEIRNSPKNFTPWAKLTASKLKRKNLVKSLC